VIFNLRHPLLAICILALSAPILRAQSSASDLSSGPRFSSSLEQSASALPDDPSSAPQQAATPAPGTAPPQNETEAQRKAREQREEGEREVKRQEKQRAVGVLPLFNVVISGNTVPLTPAQKFDLSFHTIIDPYTFSLAIVAGGGVGELEGSHHGYGWGPEGLFKRIGASYADNAIGNVVGNAALPVLLHQDPRYYRKGEGSVISRIVYSALTTFICRGDNGKKEFNTSNILGNVIAGGISNSYYPSDERGAKLTFENAATVTYEGMLGAQILEFTPDLQEYIHRRREHHRMMLQRQQQNAAPAGTTPAPKPAAEKPPAGTPQ